MLLRLLFFTLFLGGTLPSFALIKLPDDSPRVESAIAPKLLFRWVSPERLKEWQADHKKYGLRFPRLDTSQYVKSVQDLLALYSNRAAFSWIDPVLGSHGVLHEHYGGRQAVLMVFSIAPEANAVRYAHQSKEQSSLGSSVNTSKLKSADLVEHVTENLHEWIIVNPKVVQAYTFNPKITHSLWLDAFRPYFENAQYIPPLKKVHMRGYGAVRTIWGDSNWSKSIFFMDQFKAFNETTFHPWYKKFSQRIYSTTKPITFQQKGYGDASIWKEVSCNAALAPQIEPQELIEWWNSLRGE